MNAPVSINDYFDRRGPSKIFLLNNLGENGLADTVNPLLTGIILHKFFICLYVNMVC